MKRVIVLLAYWVALSSLAVAAPDAVICVLFHLSQSTQNVRAGYMSSFEKLLAQLGGGELVLGSGITANSLATGRFEINAEVPKYNPFVDSKLTFGRKLQSAKMNLTHAVQRLLAEPATPTTDLIGAMQLAEKALVNQDVASAKSRYLVIFSDMIEESAHYNFRSENITSARINAIVDAERKSRHLPALNGIQVWVSGAGGATRDKYLQIQDFWVRYFQATGADLQTSHYGATVMDFSISHP